ncbi:MAG: DUF262 domain-containing protein [Chitinophagaceae bacterium]|nr:MAG: DUF262 domain-containing protein [Chitinophagaceae bacterium]
METIREIFNNRLFRIPDYQRGYSWEDQHLDDFWQDLMNLRKDKVHYTGMISVEEVPPSEYNFWQEDRWIIEGKNEKAYFIVDGQQRLTTVIILLWVIVNYLDENEELSYDNKESIIEKYIYASNPKHNLKSYIFGYHKDNPSYEFLKREIFEQTDDGGYRVLEETAYTNNLMNAKNYFDQRVKRLVHGERETLYNKITKQLKFDFKVLEKELDIFIVFETMNNRGKPLSNLEKLKNRLIYLSTLLPDDEVKRKVLREQINESWKVVYKYLGLSTDRKIDDDAFLQNHWIMYSRYDRRQPEFYANDIFEKVFTTDNVVKGETSYAEIQNYISSIASAVKVWFAMYNPSHSRAKEEVSSLRILHWFRKLNRLGYKAFGPLIMAALLKEDDDDELVFFLKSVEAYVFLLYNVSYRKSNTGTYHFFAQASEVYRESISVRAITDDIRYWIYGDSDYRGYFDLESFQLHLNELFSRDNGSGYLDWKTIRYFLYEYELSLRFVSSSKYTWRELDELALILPREPVKLCWRNTLRDYRASERLRLAGSLGNIVLCKRNTAPTQELCFEDFRPILENGTENQKEVADFDEWNASSIYRRGLDMLSFMEKRWGIHIDANDKKKLLFLDSIF